MMRFDSKEGRRDSQVTPKKFASNWDRTFANPDMSKTHVRITDEDGNEQWVLKKKG